MIRVLVSSCLLGEKVRYHGEDAACESSVLEHWLLEGRVVAACPELAAGLSVPRNPAEISGGDGAAVLEGSARVFDSAAAELTSSFLQGARATLATAYERNVRLAVLKDGSPSCASTYIHDGTFRGQRDPGQGVTTALLGREGIRVFNERQWEEAARYLAALEAQDAAATRT
jgi:uncharacterized protein YbbK (DUF523 family)